MDSAATAATLRARLRTVRENVKAARRRCRAHGAVVCIQDLTPRELFILRCLLYHEDFELGAAVMWLDMHFAKKTTRRTVAASTTTLVEELLLHLS
eukprot:10444024-Prorocentrum_lima.AAC.1